MEFYLDSRMELVTWENMSRIRSMDKGRLSIQTAQNMKVMREKYETSTWFFGFHLKIVCGLREHKTEKT